MYYLTKIITYALSEKLVVNFFFCENKVSVTLLIEISVTQLRDVVFSNMIIKLTHSFGFRFSWILFFFGKSEVLVLD